MVESAGGQVSFVELYADLDERLVRNLTELRLAEKRSKRDTAFSEANVLDLETRYTMNTGGGPTLADGLIDAHPHLRIDNTRLSAAEAADHVATTLGLRRPM